MSYKKLIKFGSTASNSLPVYSNDPLTYCLGTDLSQTFNHGSNASQYGQGSKECQAFLSSRCAARWDAICDYAARDKDDTRPVVDTLSASVTGDKIQGLTPGELLLRNVAKKRFLVAMKNCELKCEPFQPINPSSVSIKYWSGNNCCPTYAVDPLTIDSDVVMHRLLDKPYVAPDVLTNIRKTMGEYGLMSRLEGTRLGDFFKSDSFKQLLR